VHYEQGDSDCLSHEQFAQLLSMAPASSCAADRTGVAVCAGHEPNTGV
jgi:hypothetical protein